jgi:hypothetical protein
MAGVRHRTGKGRCTPRREEKSAQRVDGKGVGELPLRSYGCKKMKGKGIEAVKESKELDELAGTGRRGGGGIDNSRPMVAFIRIIVNYYYSTSI